jgi:hypothetical protein
MLHKVFIIVFLLCAMNLHAQQFPAGPGPQVGKPVFPHPPAPFLTSDQVNGAPLPAFLLVTLPQPLPAKENVDQKPVTSAKVNLGPPKYITNKDVAYNANLFTMIFNPTCAHCEDMVELLEKNSQYFHKTKVLLFASPVTRSNMELITNGYHTDQYTQLIVGTDSLDFIKKIFLYNGLPQINIYNKKRKLIKTFTGDLTIDSLKQYIQ